MVDPNSIIRQISEVKATDLPIVGGKSANLGEMTNAGFPVPGGFIVTTNAYRAFLVHNNLSEWVRVQSAKGNDASPEELEVISLARSYMIPKPKPSL